MKEEPLRFIVCGGRDWSDEEQVFEVLDRNIPTAGPFTIVTGACPTGADEFARRWFLRAKHWNLNGHVEGFCNYEPHPADWKRHGKGAGPLRNLEMALLDARTCLAFWDGESRGTLDMIKRATKSGIPVRIFPPRRRE